MKTTTALLILSAMLFFNSCTKSSSSNSNSSVSASQTKNLAEQGSWKISYFFDNTDETSHFSGYVFTFNNSGVVTATNGGNTVSGTWSTGNDDSEVKFVLEFGNTVPFDEISDDWKVTSAGSSEIKLIDVSGGGSGTDYLTFTKN